MSLNPKNLIRGLNSNKENRHSLSPNIRPIYHPAKPIKNNLFPKNNIIANNNIKMNMNMINKKKEKIIEGELNFNNKIQKLPNNRKSNFFSNKNKNYRGMPRKSPIPIPRTFKPKGLPNFNMIFKSNHIGRPSSRKNNNNYLFQPPIKNNNFYAGRIINNTSKSFNSLNIKNERSYSPIIRSGPSKIMGIGIKPKSRYVSKSPILGKSSAFNHNHSGISLLNGNMKKIPKKTSNIVHKPNNTSKGNTVISGEIYHEFKANSPNMVNINNIRPVSSNALLNSHNHLNNENVNNINRVKVINNNNNEKVNNNMNNNNIEKININKLNNIIEDINKVDESTKSKGGDENQKLKKNNRSQSQGQIDILRRSNEKKDEDKKIEPKKVIKKIKDILPYSHVGFDGEEPKENNQDNYFIFKNFADHKDYIYLSVCDGHGVEGHFVSDFIKEVLPYYMSENLKGKDILNDKRTVHQIITETFLLTNSMLVSNENINSLFSGSTCVSVIFTPERLIVPNIGDSRAVLGRFDSSKNKYVAIDLSRDHKPTEKDEANRIYENDGRIQAFMEDGEFVGPKRVWIKDEEVPGLAMTRSFGDRVAATVGVISEPEIKEFNFDENDKFMIIASDGIWEFISSQECVDMIRSFYEANDLKGCCEFLYQESSKRWLKEEEVIDDTTLILVFFE
jgi:serine/threonine protein phosphatase PrpC